MDRFRQSLPPPASRWTTVAAIILIVVVFQLAFAGVTSTGFGGTAGPVSDVLGESATGDPGSVGRLAERLAEAAPIDLLGLFSVASFSAFLVLRVPAIGFRRAQRLLAFSEQDAKTYRELGASVPSDPPFDLAIKALFAIGIILYGLIAISYQIELGGFSGYVGLEIYAAAAVGCLGVGRLVWIGWRWYRTGSSLTPLLAACAVVTVLAIAAYVASREKAEDFHARDSWSPAADVRTVSRPFSCTRREPHAQARDATDGDTRRSSAQLTTTTTQAATSRPAACRVA